MLQAHRQEGEERTLRTMVEEKTAKVQFVRRWPGEAKRYKEERLAEKE